MTAPIQVREVALENWIAEGEQRFGPDRDQWRFRCPRCGHEQSAAEARARDPKVDQGRDPRWLRNYLGFSCEGRLGGPGCDWTLGGLILLHMTVIIMPDGSKGPIMEWGGALAPTIPQVGER